MELSVLPCKTGRLNSLALFIFKCFSRPRIPRYRQFSTSLPLAGNSGLLYPDKAQQPQEQLYPFLPVNAVVSCVQITVRLPVVGVFNVSTGVDVWDCTQGFMDTARESALEVDSGRKIHCCTTGDLLYCTNR